MVRVRSSAGEHYLHTVGVTGSIPVAPTNLFKGLDPILCEQVREYETDYETKDYLLSQ